MFTQAHRGCFSETADSPPPPHTSSRPQQLRASKQLSRRVPITAMGKGTHRAQPGRPQVPSLPPLEGSILGGGARVLTVQRGTGKACGNHPPDPPPFPLWFPLFLPLHFPSPLLSSSSICILPSLSFFISPVSLFIPSVLQCNIMGRTGPSEKTWVQVLPLRIQCPHLKNRGNKTMFPTAQWW